MKLPVFLVNLIYLVSEMIELMKEVYSVIDLFSCRLYCQTEDVHVFDNDIAPIVLSIFATKFDL